MKVILRNNLGLEYSYNCEEFVGYDAFTIARDIWENDWKTYEVISDSIILENVINPNFIEPKNVFVEQ
jgi:hypothetical protein